MMVPINSYILRFLGSLVAGILLANYASLKLEIVLLFFVSFSIALIFLFIKKGRNSNFYFEGLTYLIFLCIGVLIYNFNDDRLLKSHYSHSISCNQEVDVVFRLKKRLKPNLYNERFEASIIQVNELEVSGKILVNINKDSIDSVFNVDDLIFSRSKLVEIKEPLNPFQFDYKTYLARNNVLHQIYLKPYDLLFLSRDQTTLYGYADYIRERISNKLNQAGFDKESLSIIKALLLGQRQDINRETYDNYINSGTIHILAVSGLHIGIILWILNFLFKPLLYLKYGNYIKPILLVFILWGFAIIAGLSPSVVRAVTMFSIITVAMHLKRSTNIYNTLAISAFLLLLFNPKFLFNVGFQLSYLAVLGIVSIQPLIYNVWKPKFIIIDKLWQILTVTIAAQIGVLPISLFYFHQFPSLFFVSNIVVIPFLGILLFGGVLVIVLGLLNVLPSILVEMYSFVISSLNNFIAWIAQFEDFLFKDIPFTFLQVLISYVFVISCVQIFKTKSFKWFTIVIVSILVFQLNFICISVIIHNPVMLAITSLSKIRSPKYLRFSL